MFSRDVKVSRPAFWSRSRSRTVWSRSQSWSHKVLVSLKSLLFSPTFCFFSHLTIFNGSVGRWSIREIAASAYSVSWRGQIWATLIISGKSVCALLVHMQGVLDAWCAGKYASDLFICQERISDRSSGIFLSAVLRTSSGRSRKPAGWPCYQQLPPRGDGAMRSWSAAAAGKTTWLR